MISLKLLQSIMASTEHISIYILGVIVDESMLSDPACMLYMYMDSINICSGVLAVCL